MSHPEAVITLRCAADALRQGLFAQDVTADPQSEFWRGFRVGVENAVMVLIDQAEKLEAQP